LTKKSHNRKVIIRSSASTLTRVKSRFQLPMKAVAHSDFTYADFSLGNNQVIF